jgi:hypothetical protein
MLRVQPKEKQRRKVAIPDELRNAIRDASILIAESTRDPQQSIEFDDAIECGCLVGGRVGITSRPFEFRYFPSIGCSFDLRWDLAMSQLEIEDIAEGFVTELILYCCKEQKCGYKSTTPDGLCSCDYFDDPYCGDIAFPDTTEALRRIGLPTITQHSLRDEVIEQLGSPGEYGGGENHPRLGHVWRWIKYERPDCWLKFEFKTSGVLRGISIYPKTTIET